MYPDLKTVCYNIYIYIILVFFFIVTSPDSITTGTPSQKGDCTNEHLCSNERVQHHEDSLISKYMYFDTVSLVVLATFICIIYVGTKSTVRSRLTANNKDYDMT